MRIIQLLSILILFVIYALIKIPGAVLTLKPYGIDLYSLGDLYRYSYLKEFRDTTQTIRVQPAQVIRHMNLFVLGDSFTASFNKDHYQGAKTYSFMNWNQASEQQLMLKTDSTMKSILLVSCAEKSIRMRFARNQLPFYLARHQSMGSVGFSLKEKSLSFTGCLKKYLGRPEVTDQNIQALLFENEIALRLKETKAELNRSLFGKIAPEVEIYSEQNMLFQKLTTDPKYIYMSSFRELDLKEENELITSMSLFVDHYKKLGIDSVIFSFIPNPVSVVAPKFKGRVYNMLIPRLESRIKETGAGCLSIFESFNLMREKAYRRGDTHWNKTGALFWLTRVNQTLNF
jgi:hypothetical protein